MSVSKLIARSLHKSFLQGEKELHVLHGINVEFERKRSYAITGASGSGKSTLLHLLGGLDVPTQGSVFCDESDLFKFKARRKEKFLNTQLGFVFQFHYLIKELSVLENIMLMGLIKRSSKNECKSRAKNLLEIVGLEDKINSYPIELSGGELQRVAILRAIFNKPSFLLADEPTGDLDSQNADIIVNLLIQCQREWDMGIILCSHDANVYGRMEYVFKLHEGVLKKN